MMKKKSSYFLLSIFLFSAAGALFATAAEQNPAMLINESMFSGGTISPELQPLIDAIQPLITKISVLVGGLFGLYLILSLIRVYYEAKKVKLLQAIRYDLDQLNAHYSLPYSKTRPGLFKKTINFFNPDSKKESKQQKLKAK